jgi:FMN phosphatase YigB (HAD superfamily)
MLDLDPSKIKVIFFDAINTLFDVSSRPREELKEYVRQFEAKPYQEMKLPRAWGELPAFAGVQHGLDRLVENLRVYVLSNVPETTVRKMMLSNNIQTSRIGVIPLSHSRLYKPDPRAYVYAAGHILRAPEHCLMVTANPRIGHADHGDVEAARSVGMQACLIRNPGCPQTIIELAELLGA